jgi:glycosyltransferase involved in cell wall biosynthesis
MGHEGSGNCGMAEPYVTVCACTYRRPEGLRALLGGLATQRFKAIAPPRIEVVIVDNEGSAEARAVCAQVGQATGLAVRYVHEPRHGIPFARNACLDHVPQDASFFAMIDDDEVPEPAWLEQLLLAQACGDADVVRGAVVPVFPDGAPAWIRDGEFFGWPKQRAAGAGALADGAELASASSNNVLVRAAAVRALGLRFDATLTFTGGSDALFFRQMKLAGCRIVYAAGARVREAVPAQRATFSYLWRTHYKQGCNKVPRKLRLDSKGAGSARFVRMAVKSIPRECAEIGGGALAVAGSLVGGQADIGRLSPGLLRIAKGVGGLAGLIGVRFAHYR